MKHGHSFAIALMALALAACGGKGGNNGNSIDQPVGLTNEPRIEAVLADTSSDPEYQYQDPLNIQTGQTVQFQLVNYTGSGSSLVRHVLQPDSFQTSDLTNVAGQVSNTTGAFIASNTDTGARQYIVSAQYLGNNYNASYKVNPRQIFLRGRVLAQGTNVPVYNAEINFYARRNPQDETSSEIIVATVHSAFDGTFRVSLPAFNDAVTSYADAIAAPKLTFTIRSATLPDGFLNSFVFKGARYTAGSTICRAPIVSNTIVTDSDSGDTTFLPYITGDRYLISDGDDKETNGTILLTPSNFDGDTTPTGCTVN